MVNIDIKLIIYFSLLSFLNLHVSCKIFAESTRAPNVYRYPFRLYVLYFPIWDEAWSWACASDRFRIMAFGAQTMFTWQQLMTWWDVSSFHRHFRYFSGFAFNRKRHLNQLGLIDGLQLVLAILYQAYLWTVEKKMARRRICTFLICAKTDIQTRH